MNWPSSNKYSGNWALYYILQYAGACPMGQENYLENEALLMGHRPNRQKNRPEGYPA